MWENVETDMDPAFLERDACRKEGKPVLIAETDRLIIRETVLEDVPELYRIWKEPGMGDYIPPMQPTLEEELEYTEAYIRHAYAFYDYGLWTVLDRSSGRVVGRAGLSVSELLEDAVELGYLIAPEYQRQGLAVECAEAILAYAKNVLDITELHLLTDPENTASVRTAERLGFVKAHTLCGDGRAMIHYMWREDE